LVAHPCPGLAIRAGGIADPRLAPCLPRVPHLVALAVLDDDRAVHVVFPIRLGVGSKDNHRLAPLDAILALDQRNAFLGSPGEPPAVGVTFLEHGDVEASSEIATEYRVLRVFHPASGRLDLLASMN